jgi:cobalt-zinc-cadmium efflux system protein
VNRERRLVVATALNTGIVVAQVIAGFAAGSVGLLADAGHNVIDVGAVLLSLYALRLARRAATPERSYGYHRAGVLAAAANATAILVVTLLIAGESVRRLLDPRPVDGAVVVVVALLAAVGNGAAAWVVHEPGGGDLNLRSARLHLISDALVSLGVAAAGAVILAVDGAYWLDPLASMLISLLIAAGGVRILRLATDVLLESTPAGLDLTALAHEVRAVPGVLDVHDVHVWSLSETLRAASGHIVVGGQPTLEQAAETGRRVKAVLAGSWGIEHATLELEGESCTPDPADVCALPEPSSSVHQHHH